MTIAANLKDIRQQIEAACRRCGRDSRDVRLVAVSKKKPAAAIEAAFMAGQKLFGESYVQEFCDKQEQIDQPLEWHFIGGLQSNKVKYLRGRTALIHSVDRLSLAREISRQWQKIGQRADILLQFNLGREASKSGADENQALELARAVSELPGLQIRGLMTLPPWDEEPERVRPYFRRLRELAGEIEAAGLPDVRMEELSMGMSHDFEVAIEEGATLIRVGTAIFGARD
ncbi:YggS family pyridoxal phosphate-dependent enzyme [Geothermobacter hydrogeniphilus]|uniref:Pyridoxal phosphate homeostasis protein n=1 Tax=Geothermobacter hydrogeniphilus TaxID=1969733 RepID=A0A1X0Y3S8_9BACT|nr:YggS family pyridoxal phosphate-dependent enzyme [Geothermobacter hydrogeniphilus]ORJ59816.1 YggS family pyridoxal phosphate enzyme [Geothermobacter hydrogeniphilus]